VSQRISPNRYTRLELVLSVLLAHEKFTLADLKATLPLEKPAFITRVVRQLEREGHVRVGEDGTFSWVGSATDFPTRA